MRIAALLLACLSAAAMAQPSALFQPSDLSRMKEVGAVGFSPDGKKLTYSVINFDAPGRAYSQQWQMDLANGQISRLGGEKEISGGGVWSPDSQWIAYQGKMGDKSGLIVAHPDGSGQRFLAEMSDTNGPIPTQGRAIAWSPDGKRLAFVSAVPGPETQEATGDPIVIRRYLYKPEAGEGLVHFNDFRRLHIFIADLASGQVRQLTSGLHSEHSIDWSPDGREILFVSNREPNEDQFFNYDIFAVNVDSGAIRRLTATENAEYRPLWSPDGRMIAYEGTKRGLTDLETTMEDTHVWVMNADGSNRHELSGALDQRQGPPAWSPDGKWIYFTAQEHGFLHLYRIAPQGGKPEIVLAGDTWVTSFSLAADGRIAYAAESPTDMPQLFVRDLSGRSRKLTNLNAEVLRGKDFAGTDAFTFISNDNKWNVEAFLTKPIGLQENPAEDTPARKYPMIVVIHGGPHGMQGPMFNFKQQVYAAHGYAVLNVNYRGSTGYGQAFTDAVFGDQNGNEAQDVLYGVSAALRRYPWIDQDRLGIEGVSYGGQLSMWLITQSSEFKAAIPIAGISNLISYNYMTYYNQYEQMEWGQFPHQDDLMNILWERSALKHVASVKTPTMLVHGENDADVPIAEDEQYFIALRDVGVEAIMVRYPREGHGVRETKHQMDLMERSFQWYDTHFANVKPGTTVAVP